MSNGLVHSRREILAGALALASGSVRAETRDDAVHRVTVLHTNDFHGRHTAFEVAPGDATAQTGDPGRSHVEFDRAGRIGGFPALAAAIRARRNALGARNVLLVHGGDTFSDDLLGNFTKGEAMIRLMNAVGYQFMALGNHDFDYGFERTRELSQMARFPMRGANITVSATGNPVFGDPVRFVTVGGVTVGLLALGYHNTHLTGDRDNVRGLEFGSGIDVAGRLVPDLRRRAAVTVVVSHQGSKVDREMLRKVQGIDLVIGAHSHDLITPPERVGEGWLVQALSDVAMLGEVTLSIRDGKVAHVTGAVHPLWADEVRDDPEIAALVDQLRAPYRAELETIVARAGSRIGRQYKSESPFDKLVGRILRQETGADVAFLPGVGYGVSLVPGPITREALATLLPHPSKVATLTLSGVQIHEVLEQSATNQAPADPLAGVGGLIQSDGLVWSADLRQPAGQRVRDIAVGQTPLDPDKRYRVVVNAGMLGGIHKYDTFAKGEAIQKQRRTVTELVETALRKAGTVTAPALGDVNIQEPA